MNLYTLVNSAHQINSNRGLAKDIQLIVENKCIK